MTPLYHYLNRFLTITCLKYSWFTKNNPAQFCYFFKVCQIENGWLLQNINKTCKIYTLPDPILFVQISGGGYFCAIFCIGQVLGMQPEPFHRVCSTKRHRTDVSVVWRWPHIGKTRQFLGANQLKGQVLSLVCVNKPIPKHRQTLDFSYLSWHEAACLWSDEPTTNKEINRLPTPRSHSNISCSVCCDMYVA